MLRAIEGLEFKIAHYASCWSWDFDHLHGWAEELALDAELVLQPISIAESTTER